jgi:hypothetical protein
MSLYSEQQIFCNACGKEMHRILPGMGKTYKVCTVECLREMQWREVLSIMGKPYRPDPRKFDEYGREIQDDNAKS